LTFTPEGCVVYLECLLPYRVAENAKASHTIFVGSNLSKPHELMAHMAAF
jgi:hypothetical protein